MMETLVGHDYAYGTFRKYQTFLQHTRDFLTWKFKECDIDLKKLNFKFITDYEFYLKSVRKCGHNSTMITLSDVVPIESVSKMLGHRDLKTTQLYAKVVDKKISDDMNRLKELFGNKLH
jgi:hypothetical protein